MVDFNSSTDQDSLVSLLFKASHAIAMADNEEDILTAVIGVLRRTDFITSLLMVEHEKTYFVSFYDPQIGEIPLHEKDSFPTVETTALFTSTEPLLITETPPSPSLLFDLFTPYFNLGAKVIAVIPAFTAQKLFGVVIIASRSSQGLTHKELSPFIDLVDILANSVARLNTLQTTQTHLEGMRRSLSVALNILFETDLEPLYQIIHNQMLQLFGKVDFLIAIYHSETSSIEIPYAYEQDSRLTLPTIPLGEGLTSLLIYNRKPIMLVEDAANQARVLGARFFGEPAKSWMGVPLIVGDLVIGAMIVEDLTNEHRFDENDLDFFVSLAPQAAAAIRNAQTVTEIQKSLKAYDEEKYLLSTLMDTIPDKVYFKDRNSRFIRANRAMLSLFNTDKMSDLVGKTDFDFFTSEYATQAFNDEQEIIRSGKAMEGKLERETWPDRPDTWVLSTKAPLHDPAGNIMGVLSISREVTELVQVRETAQLRAQQLLTSAEIARDVSSALQPEELLSRVVNLVRDRFGFYQVSVFLIDSGGEYAVLRESTGEAGRQLKKAGHKLGIGSKSIVGQATATRKPFVINDVSQDLTYLPNPLLPDTRSEMAIPLTIGERILGTLDVQSTHLNAFSPDDIKTLQMLADQLSTAIANAEFFVETQKNLAQQRLLYEVTTSVASINNLDDVLGNLVEGLKVVMEGIRITILLYNSITGEFEVRAAAGYENEPEIKRFTTRLGVGITGIAAQDHQMVYLSDVSKDPRYLSLDKEIMSELALPLIFRNEVLGVLNLESPQPYAFSEGDQEVLATLASSVAVDIANVRLLGQIRQQVERQRQLFEAANKIRRSVDLKTILETSASEIGKILSAQRIQIEITAGDEQKVGKPLVQGGNGKERSQ